ncbi:MAG: redoxin domain-containing protein [Candidatus Heimdallarchaeota archaeon]|nr:redoxin domain-containing protein [Candidatus Heimdallarchaeota archaeon]
MRLREGEKAFNFTVTDLSGKTISLTNFKDKKILLSFYRYASCPLCNLRISQLIQQYDDMKKKGLVIIAFFQSPKESMLKYVGKQDVPFSLVTDPKREIYKLYRIEKSWFKYVIGGVSWKMFKALRKGYKIKDQEGQQNLVPADFLIENMVIKRAYYGRSIADHISFKEITQFLEE